MRAVERYQFDTYVLAPLLERHGWPVHAYSISMEEDTASVAIMGGGIVAMASDLAKGNPEEWYERWVAEEQEKAQSAT